MSYNVSEIVSGLMNDFRGCRVVRGIKGGKVERGTYSDIRRLSCLCCFWLREEV